jgi:hypothetical protein
MREIDKLKLEVFDLTVFEKQTDVNLKFEIHCPKPKKGSEESSKINNRKQFINKIKQLVTKNVKILNSSRS